MVLEGVGWNRKEFSESNLYVYGKDDTKIVIYIAWEDVLEKGRKINLGEKENKLL